MSKSPQRGSTLLSVVVLESRWAKIYTCSTDKYGVTESTVTKQWDPSAFLTDSNGERLLEEITRQVRSCWMGETVVDGVALTLPGTLSGSDIIVSSSRLGIRERCAVGQILTDALGVPCRAFHDVECLAVGENQQSPSTLEAAARSFVYVFADEGVGSKMLIDDETYVGAGVAGTLGRLTVQPDGSYFQALAARGPLEVYSSRPWVSENLVAMYLSEQDKRTIADETESRLEDTPFRRALRVAAAGDWRGLDYWHIADGVKNQDPIAMAVLEVAARYLGFAINSVITIIHPHRLILGGSMITEIPEFANQVIAYARRYSWPLAWNSTSVSVSYMGRQAQVYGATELWRRSSSH
jgi:predicted NBD/HSP70 family sugar kinase